MEANPLGTGTPSVGFSAGKGGEGIPPFCPNRSCALHFPPVPTGGEWYEKWGVYLTEAFGEVQRYRCKACGKTFSTQTFSVDYYSKRVVDYRKVERGLSECMSEAAVGRWCGVSGQVVRNKVGRLARQALWSQGKLYGQLGVRERVVADGFETWCGSQYFPGHVNWVVGADSQMLYLQEYVPLRRKGSMREEQRRRREEVERRGRADPQGIENSFERMGEELVRWMERSEAERLVLSTDEHPAYVRGLGRVVGLERLRREGRFEHQRVSGKVARSRYNPLFAVNYMDREVRKDVANHVRETTRGARNVNDLMNRLAIYRVVHNYRKRYRLRPDQRDDRYHGEVAGLAREEIEAEVGESYYRMRRFFTHGVLPAESWRTWTRMWGIPFREGKVYVPRFILD